MKESQSRFDDINFDFGNKYDNRNTMQKKEVFVINWSSKQISA